MLFVDSTYGSNSYTGNKPEAPLRSINYAMTKCVDDHDDLIVVLNGYNNDLTDAETNGDDTPITLDKNGVTVLFSGRNNTVQGIEADDSVFKIDANQVTLGVLKGGGIMIAAAKAGTAGTVVEIAASAVDAEVFGFYTDSCDGYDELIVVNATAHRAYIHDNYLIGDATDTDEGIRIEGTNQESRIWNNTLITCALGTAGIDVTAAAVMVDIRGNVLLHEAASKYGIKGHASATGLVIGNMIRTHNSHTSKNVSGAKLAKFENYTPATLLLSGKILPAIA